MGTTAYLLGIFKSKNFYASHKKIFCGMSLRSIILLEDLMRSGYVITKINMDVLNYGI